MSPVHPRWRAVVMATLVFVWSALPSPARAQDDAAGDEPTLDDDDAHDGDAHDGDERGAADQADRAAAESLLNVGKGLMELGQLEDACEKLEGSLAAYFIGDAALLLAECQERRGLIASAWASYRSAAAGLRKRDDPRAEATRIKAEELHATVPRLTIVAAATVPHLEVVRGETVFDDGVLGVGLAVDPGTHHIAARAPGYLPWSGEVTLRPSERKTITIPALALVPAPPEETAVSVTRIGPSEHGSWWTAGFATGAAGLLTVGAGAILGGFAAADVDAAEEDETLCGSDLVCTPEGLDTIERADRLAISSTVLLSVGGATMLAGFVMVLVDEPQPAEASVALAPWAGPGGAGLTAWGSF